MLMLMVGRRQLLNPMQLAHQQSPLLRWPAYAMAYRDPW